MGKKILYKFLGLMFLWELIGIIGFIAGEEKVNALIGISILNFVLLSILLRNHNHLKSKEKNGSSSQKNTFMNNGNNNKRTRNRKGNN